MIYCAWYNSGNRIYPYFLFHTQSTYILKLGYAGVYLLFLFLLQNIHCGYLLEPPPQDGSNLDPQSLFWSKNKKNKKFSDETFNSYNLKQSLYIAWASFRYESLLTH